MLSWKEAAFSFDEIFIEMGKAQYRFSIYIMSKKKPARTDCHYRRFLCYSNHRSCSTPAYILLLPVSHPRTVCPAVPVHIALPRVMRGRTIKPPQASLPLQARMELPKPPQASLPLVVRMNLSRQTSPLLAFVWWKSLAICPPQLGITLTRRLKCAWKVTTVLQVL